MAGMDMEEANVALDVISKCSATMSRNSEKTRSVFKELHHSVSAWSNQQRDLDGEHAEACEKIVKRCDVVAMEREAALQQYALTSKENSLYEMQYKQDVDELVDRISTLSVKNDVFPVEQRRTKKEISARVEKLDQRRAQADQLLRRNKRTREKLDLNIAAYQRAFGLSVSTVSPSTMQFEFDHIDPRDPRRKFVVTIVESDEKHRAGDCRPMIAGFEALGRELDLTNKLEPFLLAVRKGFQALVAQ